MCLCDLNPVKIVNQNRSESILFECKNRDGNEQVHGSILARSTQNFELKNNNNFIFFNSI